jgi:hypothetical protein
VLVAVVTAAAGTGGAFIGGLLQAKGSRHQAETAAKAAMHSGRSDRFAAWQMHKRTAYAELLDALRTDAAASTGQTQREVLRAISKAQMLANEELRRHLYEVAHGPQRLHDPEALRVFVEDLVVDVLSTGQQR